MVSGQVNELHVVRKSWVVQFSQTDVFCVSLLASLNLHEIALMSEKPTDKLRLSAYMYTNLLREGRIHLLICELEGYIA